MNKDYDIPPQSSRAKAASIAKRVLGLGSSAIPSQRNDVERLKSGEDIARNIAINRGDDWMVGTSLKFPDRAYIEDTNLFQIADDEIRILSREKPGNHSKGAFTHVIVFSREGTVYTQIVIESPFEETENARFTALPVEPYEKGRHIMSVDQTQDLLGVAQGSILLRLHQSEGPDNTETQFPEASASQIERYHSVLKVAAPGLVA